MPAKSSRNADRPPHVHDVYLRQTDWVSARSRERMARPSILRQRPTPPGSWRRRECRQPRTAGRAGLEGHWFAALQQRAYLASADIDLLLCRYRGRESQEKDRPSAQAACSSRNLLSQSISRWKSSSGHGITEFSYDDYAGLEVRSVPAPRAAAGLQEIRDSAERERIRQALDQTDWNVSAAAGCSTPSGRRCTSGSARWV